MLSVCESVRAYMRVRIELTNVVAAFLDRSLTVSMCANVSAACAVQLVMCIVAGQLRRPALQQVWC